MAEAPTARAQPRRGRADARGRDGWTESHGRRQTRPAEAERATEAQRGAEARHGRQRQTRQRTHPRTHAREERRRSREKGRRGGKDARRLYTAINNRPARTALETALNRATEGERLRSGVLSLARMEAQNPPESPHTDTPKKFFCESCKKVLTNRKQGCIISAEHNKTKQNTTPRPPAQRRRKRERKMLFEEFREGTGCKDNPHNRELYRKIESLYYTAERMTKAEAYEIAKHYLNNEPSEEEKRVWAEVKNEAAALDWDVMHYTAEAERYTEWAKDTTAHDESVGWTAKYYRDEAKRYREIARTAKARAAALRRWFPEAFII